MFFAYAQVTDFEGNIYDTVVIGKQTWLKQNLRSKYYSDGVPIPQEYYLPTKGIDSLVKRYGYLYHYKAYSRDERGKKFMALVLRDILLQLPQNFTN
ncbi:MAG: hypothetical protein IPG87_11890 [Saprospiraceae bacterium]|nr:hypothetical protein [Candidatus Vicinibacter affinis]